MAPMCESSTRNPLLFVVPPKTSQSSSITPLCGGLSASRVLVAADDLDRIAGVRPDDQLAVASHDLGHGASGSVLVITYQRSQVSETMETMPLGNSVSSR
jgi:hypothetical protein